MTFKEKLDKRIKTANSLLCVGLDSHYEKLPKEFREKDCPQFEFNKYIIDATHEYTIAYKPNPAFYETRGDEGTKELKMTMEYLQGHFPDIPTICDAKRGDIKNTNIQYAAALFDWFCFDAVTLHPYLGREALEPFLERKDKGCIILCRTSNPGAGELQDLEIRGKPLWQIIAQKVRDAWNANDNCTLFIGATWPHELREARTMMGDMTFLVAGVDTQGGKIQEIMEAGLNSKKQGLIINASRSIIFAADPRIAARDLRDEINRFRS